MSSSRPEKYIINVQSFDMDGCIFTPDYINTCKLHPEWNDKERDKYLIKSNKTFLDTIITKIKLFRYNEVILKFGTSRQSRHIDDYNNDQHKTGSCFPVLEKLLHYLQSKLPDTITCRYDGYLLADTYGKKPAGENCSHAINNDKEYSYSDSIFDTSKLSLLYAQMHKVASENPGADIVFDFYDDMYDINKPEYDILHKLYNFFCQHSDLIPRNLKLNLHHYDGNNVTNLASIQGTGAIDYNYQRNVIFMAKCAGFTYPYRGMCDFINQLTMPDAYGLKQFKERRVLTKDSEPHREHQTNSSVFSLFCCLPKRRQQPATPTVNTSNGKAPARKAGI